jgi:hypothetical protein
MTRTELRRLARHVSKAHAALVPLVNGHTHDGKPLPGREQTLQRALAAVREAGALVAGIAPGSASKPRPLS